VSPEKRADFSTASMRLVDYSIGVKGLSSKRFDKILGFCQELCGSKRWNGGIFRRQSGCRLTDGAIFAILVLPGQLSLANSKQNRGIPCGAFCPLF
jgi:hypothetical protein